MYGAVPLLPVKVMIGEELFWHRVVDPEIEALGKGLTVVVTGADVAWQPFPSVTVTE